MELSEDELIAAISRVLSGAGPEVIVGPGDDAAVLAAPSGQLVLTADALIEGVHFDLGFTSPRDLGYKAVVVNVSDIAAMGASPRAALVTLALARPARGRVGDGAVRRDARGRRRARPLDRGR